MCLSFRGHILEASGHLFFHPLVLQSRISYSCTNMNGLNFLIFYPYGVSSVALLANCALLKGGPLMLGEESEDQNRPKTAWVLNVLILLAHQTPALNDHRGKGTGLFALKVFFYKKTLLQQSVVIAVFPFTLWWPDPGSPGLPVTDIRYFGF